MRRSIPVTCTATLSGLGNADVNVRLSASGFALYQCHNGGGNTAPGQKRMLAGPATSNTAGRPNPNWTGVNPTLTLTTINLVTEQPPGTPIFTCSASSEGGLTSPVTVAC